MYAGAVAVPLIVGRALKRSPEQVARLISADLFCCGPVTLIQSLGFGRHFGIKLPVMRGVTFAAVGPMVAMANVQSGPDGARAIFGAIIGAGVVAMLDAFKAASLTVSKVALSRKCCLATLLDPRGGRAGRSPDLGVLMSQRWAARECTPPTRGGGGGRLPPPWGRSAGIDLTSPCGRGRPKVASRAHLP